MAGSVYLRRVQAINRNQGPSDVQRGMEVGQQVGKLLGGLSEAIKSSQKDALANKLMTDQSISEQPGAGQTQSLGKLGGDGSSGDGGGDGGSSDDQLRQAMAASQLSAPSGQPQTLGQLPTDSPMTPGPSGAQAMPDSGVASDQQLQQAMAASQLGSGPTVGSISPPGGPQPASVQATPTAPDFSIDQDSLAPSGPTNTRTVGDLMHTGGAQEMELRKEMLGQQIQKANLAKTLAGETPDPIAVAQKRANLLKTQLEIANAGKDKTKPDKNPPAVNFDSEPVIDQNQLNNTIDKDYGKNAASNIAATLNVDDTVPNPKFDSTQPDSPSNPAKIPNPEAPALSADGNSVTVGPKNKRITMPLSKAQIYAKQYNYLQIKNGLPPVRVPFEDQSAGSQTNPYPAKTRLDAQSRQPGTWVSLPDGTIRQVGLPKRSP